ncbi:MAG: sensor domain-containing diguanylate cyclase [Pseudomonadota bacterium]
MSEKEQITHLLQISDMSGFELVPYPVWVFDIDNYGFWWGNQSALDYWEMASVEAFAAKDMSGDDEGAATRMLQCFDRAAKTGVSKDPWTTYADGQAKTILIMHRAVLIGEEKRHGIMGFVNEQVNIGNEPEVLLLAEAMRYTQVAVSCFRLDGSVVTENPAATELYSTVVKTESRKTLPDFVARFANITEGRKQFTLAQQHNEGQWEYAMQTASGASLRSLDIRMSKHPLTGESLVLVSDYDINELRNAIVELENAKEELRLLANYDSLTGLPTVRLFKENLKIELQTAERNQTKVALQFVDLDGFKEINDSYGHDVGDAVLKEVGKRLSAVLRKSDRVGRIGGDEFVFLQPDIKDATDTSIVAERVIESLNKPIVIDNVIASVGVSIGIAIYPDDGDDSEALFRVADDSMYHVKRNGKNNFQHASEILSSTIG